MSTEVGSEPGLGLRGISAEGLQEMAKEVSRLIFIAGSQRGSVAVQLSLLASMIYDELISAAGLREHAEGVALYTGYPMTDAADLVDCLGDERVGKLLGAAAKALITGNLEADRGDLNLFADCLGWLVSPDKMLDDMARAAAVLVSFTGAFNKWLESLAGNQEGF